MADLCPKDFLPKGNSSLLFFITVQPWAEQLLLGLDAPAVIRTPQVGIDLAIRRLNCPLLKAFAKAVTGLSGDGFLQLLQLARFQCPQHFTYSHPP